MYVLYLDKKLLALAKYLIIISFRRRRRGRKLWTCKEDFTDLEIAEQLKGDLLFRYHPNPDCGVLGVTF